MASEDNTFPEASFRTVPELLSQLTETWKKSEEYLLQKVTDSAYKLTKKEMDYEALRKKQNETDKHNESLKKKIEGLEDELKKKVNDFDEMKKVNDQDRKKIRAYEKMVLDYDVKFSSLEKLGNELMGSRCSSINLEVKKQKDVAAGNDYQFLS
ncbi:hypothetical protein CTI12_AA163360 [Artemisia annua]|uniref:Uncharacterized protein n=1 Tax=Artemisia annua TaxID=35608 RepID=A0A2U1PDV4_ARTAN|nr:hypothetical protein CTI12_AA163360 [Artemisia annua]